MLLTQRAQRNLLDLNLCVLRVSVVKIQEIRRRILTQRTQRKTETAEEFLGIESQRSPR
jgi:hypothetical protein